MKIAICDDEIGYVNDVECRLKKYFSEHGLSLNLDKYNSGVELLNSGKDFDIVFLDIEMPDINGIELGKRLQKTNPDLVLIYITAYNHYLDEALDLGITRFFDKPIDEKRFYKGLEKAIEKLDLTEVQIHLKNSDNGIATVKMNDIIMVEIENRKTKIVTKNEAYYSKNSIRYWRERLNKSCFESPHNSFIVNTNYITYFCKEYIILDEKYNVPISYPRRAEFKKKFMMLLED